MYLDGLHQLQGRDDVLRDHLSRDQGLHGHLLHLVTEANQHTDLLGLLKRAQKQLLRAGTHSPHTLAHALHTKVRLPEEHPRPSVKAWSGKDSFNLRGWCKYRCTKEAMQSSEGRSATNVAPAREHPGKHDSWHLSPASKSSPGPPGQEEVSCMFFLEEEPAYP